jgi:hypothetical protein
MFLKENLATGPLAVSGQKAVGGADHLAGEGQHFHVGQFAGAAAFVHRFPSRNAPLAGETTPSIIDAAILRPDVHAAPSLGDKFCGQTDRIRRDAVRPGSSAPIPTT